MLSRMMFCLYLPLIFDMFMTVGSSDIQSNGCDQGWYAVDQFCWAFFKDRVVFGKAKKNCEGHYGNLATVWTEEEWNFVFGSTWQFFSNSSTEATPTTATNYPTTTAPNPTASGYASTDETTVAGGPFNDTHQVPTAPVPDFGLWIGYRRIYWLKFLRFFWTAVDLSLINYLSWRSDYDETLNSTGLCVAAGLDMGRSDSAAFYCNTQMDGYICKKPRPTGYTIGRSEDEGVLPMDRNNGVTDLPGHLSTCTFFVVNDMSLYLTNASELNAWNDIEDASDAGICADHCFSLPMCVYFHTTCSTNTQVCDSLACSFFSIA